MTQMWWLFEFHNFKIKIMMMDRFDLFTVTFFGFQKWSEDDSTNHRERSDYLRILVPFQTSLSMENKFAFGGGFCGF